MTESVVLGAIIKHRQKERDELQSHVDHFHACGGKTQYLKPGEASVKQDHHLTRERRRKLYEEAHGKTGDE
jgi:hypothetical protein